MSLRFVEIDMTCRNAGQTVAKEHRLKASAPVSTSGDEPSVNSQRLLGAYYTPDELATVLATWALEFERGTVLDPSFGGCAFLNAATKVLADKGLLEPGRMVFGVDVDSSCLEYVRCNESLVEENCIVSDFLSLTPEEVPGSPFKAVIGNPPYLRHHWFNGTSRIAGRTAVRKAGVKLPETASAWAYFLVHAMSFLEKGGRLAFLVPEAILQADYAASVRDLLVESFHQVSLVYIRDRLFEGTDEAVVAVIASGYGKQGSIRVESVERTEDLATILETPEYNSAAPLLTTEKGRCVDPATVDLLSEIGRYEGVMTVSELATVKVGLVTGANRHFVRNSDNLEQLGVPSDVWVKLVSRTRWLKGLDFTQEELQELVDSGETAILVRPDLEHESTPGVWRWIQEGIDAGTHKRFKCAIRDPWFRVDLQREPDAFATCARMGPPLLVLNRAGSQCTNALHVLHWHREDDTLPSAVAVGFLTSAVSVWAELYGRRYGGGVLKMEPSTLGQVPVPIVRGVESAFDELNYLFRSGREDDARMLADDLILRNELGLSKKEIKQLQRAGRELMCRRRPVRKGTDRG